MQILYTYTYPDGKMKEFDYIENSLVFYRTDYPLQLDQVPAISRKFKYRAKKPRSTHANPIHIQVTLKCNDRV